VVGVKDPPRTLEGGGRDSGDAITPLRNRSRLDFRRGGECRGHEAIAAPGTAVAPRTAQRSRSASRVQRAISSSVPARKPARQAWRRIFPLDVFGIVPIARSDRAWI